MAAIWNSCFWLLSFEEKIETAKPEQNVHGRKHLWKVLHKVSSKQNDR
jgi:hypothetical protein